MRETEGSQRGLSVRREVLGAEYVDRAVAASDEIGVEFQNFLNEYCWGLIWTDERLSRKERSLLTLGMTAALNRMGEFETHTLGALRNGVTPRELGAIVRQIAVYCGVPAGVGASAKLRKVLAEQKERMES